MAKTLSSASEEYVKLLKEVVAETRLDKCVDFQAFNLIKAKGRVVKVTKANEVAELLTNREDLVVVGIYEKAFDLVDEQTRRLWLESALSQVSYDYDKGKITIGDEPEITLTLGFYNKYHNKAVELAELELLTLQQIQDQEKEEKERRKAEKAAQRKTRRKF